MPGRIVSPLFVGRREELAALQGVLDQAVAGHAATVLIAGDAGVGKTRLIDEFRRRVTAGAVRWMHGDCVPMGEHQLPYAPITGALRNLSHGSDEDRARLDTPEFARLLPELGLKAADQPPSVQDSLAQARLFERLLTLLATLGAERPVLFSVEDVHWADQSTRDFLSFLIRNARTEHVAVICTYRTDELHRQHPLRPFLVEHQRLAAVQTLQLRPFSRSDLEAQLEGIIGAPPELKLAERVYERSEGNAFFAEELLASARTGHASLPSTVRDALSLRIERLSEPTQRVLRVMAACGRTTRQALLAAVAQRAEADLEDSLREALSAQVLTQDADTGTLAFRHALLRETVYADLVPGERARLHLALAETISADRRLAEPTGSSAAELAFHWRAANRPTAALAASIEAGTQAEGTYASAEASGHFERALELWEEVDDPERHAGMGRADVLLRATRNALTSGQTDRAVALARNAIASIDAASRPATAGLARGLLGRCLWESGEPDEALAEYRQAVELLPAEPLSAERARVLAGLGMILMMRGRARESRSLCEEAIAIARRVGALAEESHALCTLGSDLCDLGDRAQGIEHLRKAKSIAEQCNSAEVVPRAYQNLADALAQAGRLDEAVELGIEGAEQDRKLGDLRHAAHLIGDVTTWLVRLGRLDDAEAIAARALGDHSQGLPAAMLLSARAEVAIQRGEPDIAERALASARQAAGSTHDSMHLGILTDRPALLALLRGDPDAAAKFVDTAVSRMDEDELVMYTSRTYAVGLRAQADRAVRAHSLRDSCTAADAERAGAALLARLEKLIAPDRWIASPPPESAAYGALAAAEHARLRGKDDASTWNAVAAHWTQLGYPLELAYARWRQAEAALAAGTAQEVPEKLLQEAAEIAESTGARWLADEMRVLARNARIDIAKICATDTTQPPSPEAAQLGLTDRELEVLALLADGHTNPQIAKALFISPKTASAHVSHILSKLDVKTRVEAATTAHRLGLMTHARAIYEGRGSGPRP
ncbi:MAG TPA: AAA family ATPase [Solirubrobacteraceae bacterium]|nr:AAA family ATPase [Solirubrobacteraceae bacterium]